MINIKNKLYFLYLTITGLLIILSHLYLRLFRSKETYTLDSLKDHITPMVLIFSISFILMQLIPIISILYFWYKQYYNIVRTSKLLTILSKILDKIYWEPLEHIHDMVAPDLPYSGAFILVVTEFLERGNKELRKKIYWHSYILFEYVPQIFVSSVFFIDIVILNHFKYFLYVIGLLLVPVLFKIYLKLCSSFYSRNNPTCLKYLVITPVGEQDSNNPYKQYIFTLKEKYAPNQALLDEVRDAFILFQELKYNTNMIKENSAKYYAYIILFTSTLYFTGALYRLIYILYLTI